MYEFTLRQHGTFMYHPHHDEMTQMALGMMGMFVVHPREPDGPRVDRDFVLMLHEWKIDAGHRAARPERDDRLQRADVQRQGVPGDRAAAWRSTGERVRIRLGNLSAMDHHPIHLHGYYFQVTETDGGAIPEAGAVARDHGARARRAARARSSSSPTSPGDWAMHCHMTHHVMNQMGHGLPNMIGVEPGRARPAGAAARCPAT